ncbi:hypothetical protein ACIBQ1_22420 [Nonomuraea sp. NPDC050153]|uniref:hypothetical protein n=1 Tax=Nonomuraea sp. NPDC050153 TaxID=3364359 RepID=UPI0037BCDB14
MSTPENDRRLRITGLRRHGVRALAVGAALTASLAVVAGPAHATTDVGMSGSELQIYGGVADDNIDLSVSGDWVIVSNTSDAIDASAPCRQVSATRVACPGGPIESIAVITGEGDDTVRNRTRFPIRANLKPGKDNLVGGTSPVTISGSGNVVQL